MTTTFERTFSGRIFRVGGQVRDRLMGLPVHDVDFTIVDPEGFDHMVADLVACGLKVHTTTPDKFTARCRVPDDLQPLIGHRDSDFVLAREDGPYSDGRRPDWVRPADLAADQARRDFTVNSMATTLDGRDFFDPFNGKEDVGNRVIRFVGDPAQRVREDGLRVVRMFRFAVTKGFRIDPATWAAGTDQHAADMLARVSVERVRDEVFKMFQADTCRSMELLTYAPRIMHVVFDGPLWLKVPNEGPLTLEATLKSR